MNAISEFLAETERICEGKVTNLTLLMRVFFKEMSRILESNNFLLNTIFYMEISTGNILQTEQVIIFKYIFIYIYI